MPEPTAEDLERTRAQLQEDIHEARGVLKDLRYEIKAARELVPLLAEQLFTAEVKKQVDQLNAVTDAAMKRSVEQVVKSFDDLAATLMGNDKTSRRQGKVPIPDLLKARQVLDAARRERRGRP
ncbi:hypothetical protein [Streptomyces sp. NPDC020951]|uniref:hypothetical protein n=1 Tax=Streptomyces sp. NPDC020951 TaxID=3365104 RepID=UPI00379974AF